MLIFGKEAWTFILALWLDLAELGAFPDSTSYLVFPFCFCYVPSPLWLALLLEGVGSAGVVSIPPPAAPVLMHFNSLTALEIKG